MRWISGASRTRGAHVLLGGVAVLALAGAARAASSPDADLLFESARADMKQGNFAAARGKLIESLQLEETVGTLFNLGLCEEKLGLIRDSLEHVRGALGRAAEDDRRRPIMAALVASLERRVSRVVLKRAAGDGAELQLTLDGRAVEASPDGREILVDPGEHQLLVRGRRGPDRMMALHVDEGGTVVQTLVEPHPFPIDQRPDPASGLVAAAPPPASGGRLRPRLGAVAINAGGAAVIGGALLGFMAFERKISVDHHCTATACDDAGLRASTQGAAYANASTVLSIAGLAAVAGGSYALFGPGASPAQRPTPRERSVGMIAGTVGAAAIVASAIAGGVALSAQRDLLQRCGDSGPCGDPQGLDAAARGRTATTIARGALGVGVASLGVASYTLLLRPSFASATDIRLTLSPAGLACGATF